MSDNNASAGHPMNEIARQFKAPAEHVQELPTSSETAHDAISDDRVRTMADGQSSHGNFAAAPPFSLIPGRIEAPSFFVDRHLSLEWLAPGGSDDLSVALSDELASGAEKDIFSLLQKPSVKAAVADWNALFSFAYVFLRRSTSREVFDSKVVAAAQDHRSGIAEDAPTNTATRLPFVVDSRLLEDGGADRQGPLRVFGIGFSEGTLFLLRHDPWFDPQTAGVKPHPPADSLMDPRDIKTSVCILSIRLNDSHRIADTMLPEVFFRLMNIVWHEVDDVATALGGKRIGNSGAHTHYVFKANAGRNPIYSAICCAVRINGRMSSLEAKITEDLGWVDEICVNMGISQGNVDPERSDSDGGMDLKIPGGPFDQASLLSVIAGKGQIWITKNAVAQLPKPLIAQVVVGIERKGQFRRNFFTRIEDMPTENLPDMPKPDLGALSIARILKAEQR